MDKEGAEVDPSKNPQELLMGCDATVMISALTEAGSAPAGTGACCHFEGWSSIKTRSWS
jgi:hypothetical protein